MLRVLFGSTLAFLIAQPVSGYVLEGQSWTLNRTVQIQLSLVRPQPLMDGFASFNASAVDALQKWNAHTSSLTFVPKVASPVVPRFGDGQNSVLFANAIYGDTFGIGVLAVTLLDTGDSVTAESDTFFNSGLRWDSYSGPLQGSLQDFHRVALHEFGHTVGLDHPDDFGETVAAIMNSRISDLDRLQSDDIAGAEALYPPTQAYSAEDGPILSNISTRAVIEEGEKGLIGGFIVQSLPVTVIVRALGPSLAVQGLTNVLADPMLTLFDENGNQIGQNDNWVDTPEAATFANYHLDPPASTEAALLENLPAGAYTAVITGNPAFPTLPPTGTALFELYDLHEQDGRAGNLSTRGQVLGADGVLIGGFIVGGTMPKPIVVRALGPSLSATVSGSLPDPLLELYDGDGKLIESNDDWQESPEADLITSEGLAPGKAKESALQATLSPGHYTAIVRGAAGPADTGIGLVEVYDLSEPPQ